MEYLNGTVIAKRKYLEGNLPFRRTGYQSVANIRIIRIFLAKYLIFEYEYQKIGKQINSNIRSIQKLGYEYI